MLSNDSGSTHEDAVRTQGPNPSTQDERAASTLSLPALTTSQVGHLATEGKEEEEEGFPSEDSLVPAEELVAQLLSVRCSKVVLACSVSGTLVLTKSSIAFTADDTCPEYEKSLCMVSKFTCTL